jgi:hypothetical protein
MVPEKSPHGTDLGHAEARRKFPWLRNGSERHGLVRPELRRHERSGG